MHPVTVFIERFRAAVSVHIGPCCPALLESYSCKCAYCCIIGQIKWWWWWWRTRYTISQDEHNLKTIKQPCGLNGQHRTMPLTCSENVTQHTGLVPFMPIVCCRWFWFYILIDFDFILYYNLLLCFIQLEMHVRLICAIKFCLLS